MSLMFRPPLQTPPKSYTEWCGQIRRRLRPYSVTSVIDACMSILDHWRGKGMEELRSAPWLTLLIVKLALEDDALSLNVGARCPVDLVETLRSELWSLPADENVGAEPTVFLMFRSLVHTQFLLQQPVSSSFIRWPALISRLPQEHDLRIQFKRVFGYEPDTYIGLAYAAFAAVNEGATYISPVFFEPLRPFYGNAIDQFLEKFAQNLSSLRSALRSELHARIFESSNGQRRLKADANHRSSSEKIEFPWLSRFPFLRHQSGRLAVWHPLVFARGMEDAVHQSLSDGKQAYTDPFSRVFEAYVLELLQDCGLPFYGEEQLKYGDPSRPAVEALITLNGCNVFIESKMSLFPDQVLISDRGPLVFSKLRRVREGMAQGWRMGELLRDGTVNIGNAHEAVEDYLIIVTSRQLNLCSGEHFVQMFGADVASRINPESKFFGASQTQLNRLPLKNIFILSIEEFEHLCGAVADGQVNLGELLGVASKENADPQTSSLHFDQILRSRVKHWTPSKLIQNAKRKIEGQLQIALKGRAM